MFYPDKLHSLHVSQLVGKISLTLLAINGFPYLLLVKVPFALYKSDFPLVISFYVDIIFSRKTFFSAIIPKCLYHILVFAVVGLYEHCVGGTHRRILVEVIKRPEEKPSAVSGRSKIWNIFWSRDLNGANRDPSYKVLV